MIQRFLAWLLVCTGFGVAAAPNWEALRSKMVDEQLAARGIKSKRVLDAMRKVPRHLFVPQKERTASYGDHPLPIGHGQTISQPYIVALMTELAQLDGSEKVLEIGTGSGYQAAILGELAREVYTIELVPQLAARAADALKPYPNVHTRAGDGYLGWPEHAPFDAIVVTAAPEHVPQPLQEQLAEGGVMVIPVGSQEGIQSLKVLVKKEGKLTERDITPVRFVPLVH